MLGASLRDYNIVNYLKQTDADDAQRYALLSIQGDPGFEIGTQDEMLFEVLSAIQERRGDEIGISVLAPDFFGQTTQFLIELERAAALASRPDNTCYIPYKDRIRNWAEQFLATTYGNKTRREAATKKLEELADFVRGLTRSDTDHLIVELWVRNDIEHRNLELWASSQLMWSSDDQYWPYREHLSHSSTAPAVASFRDRAASTGRVTHREDGRWTHYLSAPIVLVPEPYWRIPVGVVVVLLNAPKVGPSESIPTIDINEASLVAELVRVGVEILSI